MVTLTDKEREELARFIAARKQIVHGDSMMLKIYRLAEERLTVEPLGYIDPDAVADVEVLFACPLFSDESDLIEMNNCDSGLPVYLTPPVPLSNSDHLSWLQFLKNELETHRASIHYCENCGHGEPSSTDTVCSALDKLPKWLGGK